MSLTDDAPVLDGPAVSRGRPGGAEVPGEGSGGLAVLLALIAGLALLVAHEPYRLWWMVFLVTPLLLSAVHRRPEWSGRLGLLAGLVTHLVMLRWLVAPAGAVAWLLLSLVTATWTAGVLVLVRPWVTGERGRSWWSLPVVVTTAWTGAAFLRTHHPFSGFGWATLDLAHASGSPWLGLARTTGGAGLEALTVAVGALAWVAWERGPRERRVLRGPDLPANDAVEARRAGGAAVGLLLAGLLAAVAVPVPSTDGVVAVGIVQGDDFETSDLAARDQDRAIVDNLVAETDRVLAAASADGGRLDVVLWPEYAVDRDPTQERNADLAERLAGARDTVDAQGGRLVAGIRRDVPGGEYFRNTIAVLPAQPTRATDGATPDGSEAIAGNPVYAKRRPVPFGEYVPFRHLLGGYPPLAAQVSRDALPGRAIALEIAEGVHAAVLICFETIYRDLTRSNLLATPDGEPGGLVLAMTTDASYGRLGQSEQHVAQSQMRAVETGRHVLHGALSGSSAVIDSSGRVLQQTELYTVDSLRAEVPLATGWTPFLRTGDVVGNLAAWGAVALVLLRLRSALRRRRAPRAAR